jgi:hypothetical protein
MEVIEKKTFEYRPAVDISFDALYELERFQSRRLLFFAFSPPELEKFLVHLYLLYRD